MPIKAAIGRVGLVSAIGIIVLVAAIGAYAYTDTSQMTADQTTSSSVSTTTSLSEKLSGTSNRSTVSNSEWHFEATVAQNESGIAVQSNLTSIVNKTRSAIFGDPIFIVVIRQLNGSVVYSPVITALARIVNVSFGQSFLSTQQIQVALQAHETYNFVITPQVGDNSTSGAPGVSIEFTTLFTETTATASNLSAVASSTKNPTTTSSLGETATTHTAFTNTFFTSSCSISGVGGFEFRIVSDLTRQPVNADSISAVDRLGCNNENQVVYLNQFSSLGDGWFLPIFPSQATVGGGLTITATYEGKTYNFTGDYPPVGTDCVTLSVPSGNVSSPTVMNGSGSYCSQTMVSNTSSMVTTTCTAGYVNGTCELMTTTITNLFDGASYCLGSNECSTLDPPTAANPNIENASGGNLTFRFSSSNVQLQVVQTQGCASSVSSCTHNDLAIVLQTSSQCSESGSTTLCTFVTDGISLPSVSATGNYVEINLSYGLSANQTLGSETYYLAVK